MHCLCTRAKSNQSDQWLLTPSLSMVIRGEECLSASCVSKHFFSTIPKPGKCSFATLCVITLHHVYLK